jgi:hypothetical protein
MKKAILTAVVLCLAMAGVANASVYPPPGAPVTGPISHGTGCWVPKLTGKTLPQVRSAYSRHAEAGGRKWCGLGKISGNRSGVVVKQSPRANAILHRGVAIDIVLR